MKFEHGRVHAEPTVRTKTIQLMVVDEAKLDDRCRDPACLIEAVARRFAVHRSYGFAIDCDFEIHTLHGTQSSLPTTVWNFEIELA